MSKINQIEKAILELEGGKFQKLANSYLHMRGYQNISTTGSVIASDKTRKGTPDTFITQPNGRFIFVEHTTEQNNLEKKINSDLSKCLDVDKHGIPLNEIEEIIFCHTSVLSPDIERPLRAAAAKHGIKISIFGLNTIALDLCQKYPGLARDHLGVDIDKGQIISPAEFVEKSLRNQVSTPLNTTLMFRDNEVSDLVSSLEKEDLVVLSGSAGVGKSRLAIEALNKYKEKHPDFGLYCVVNGGQDLFDDLQVYFKKSGKFLILVDDANRISKFDYVTHLLLNQRADQEIKVISTVRDYASDKILNSSTSVKRWTTRKIEPLKDEQIKEIVKSNYNITNPVFLDRIADISKGNPRLAIMAAKIASKENSLNSIQDVSSLYDQYFQSIRQDLEALGDENIIKVAGAISFFRNVDKTNEEMMSIVSQIFNMSSDDFWNVVKILHSHELVDLYKGEVVKISDQVLATYLFYLHFLKNNPDNFKSLFELTFPQHEGRLRDAIYPCLNSFNPDDVISKIEKSIKEKWMSIQGDMNLAEKLIHLFWFIFSTDSLLYIKQQIQNLPVETIDPFKINWNEHNISREDRILELLGLFSHAREKTDVSVSIELICDYIEKNQKVALSALSFLTKDFGFTHLSHWRDYQIPKMVIETLHKRSAGGKETLLTKLYIEVANEFLSTKHDSTSGGKRSITIHSFELLPRPTIFEIRKTIFDDLFLLYKEKFWQHPVLNALKKYSNNSYGLSQIEIVRRDAKLIIPFIKRELDPNNLEHAIIVHDYLSLLETRKIDFDPSIAAVFTNKTFELYSLLSKDRGMIIELEFKEAEKLRKEDLLKYTEKFSLDDYKNFIAQYTEILSVVGNGKTWQLNTGLLTVLTSLAENNPELYADVIEYNLSIKNPLSVSQPHGLVESLVKICGRENSFKIISQEEYPHKNIWIFAYLMAIPKDQIKNDDLSKLYDLYKNDPHPPYNWDFLRKYEYLDQAVIPNIANILLDRTKTNNQFGHAFNGLFNPHSEVNKNLFEIFKERLDVLKKSYIAHIMVDKLGDYNCGDLQQILKHDPSFIAEYIDSRYAGDDTPGTHNNGHNYSILWKSPEGKEIMRAALMRIFMHEEKNGYFGSYIERLFCINHTGGQPADEIINIQDDLLTDLITKENKDSEFMKFIFGAIAHFEPERKRKLIGLFLNKNKSYEAFEQLPIEPDHWSWSGSAVPLISSRIDFLQSLLPLLEGIAFLQHKQYIEKMLEGHQRWIESEKKSDFLDD